MARLLFIAGLIGFAVFMWNRHNASAVAAQFAQDSPNGFISVIMPDGAAANSVVILAPVNCPSDGAQRADALASQLTGMGIPNVRSSSYTTNITDPSEEQRAAADRAVSVLNGQVPAVFINGMAKSNPTAEEVAAEYERTKG